MAESRPILGYWNIRAGNRGNVNRYILKYAGVDFEDKRYDVVNNPGEWKEQDKQNLGLDFPNLPYIIDGDFKLTESKAVTQYICAKWAPALLGTTPSEKARVHQLTELLIEHVFGFIGFMFGSDDREAAIALSLKNFDGLVKVLGN